MCKTVVKYRYLDIIQAYDWESPEQERYAWSDKSHLPWISVGTVKVDLYGATGNEPVAFFIYYK